MMSRSAHRCRRGRPAEAIRSAVLALLLGLSGLATEAQDRIVIGSKNFAESRLLAEIFAQAIETRTEIEVERRFNLAGTQVCFEALRTGSLDLYPEYTGTGWASILGREPIAGASQTLSAVRHEFLDRYDIHWLSPLGFENAYEIAVPRSLADRLGLRTISDLAAVASDLDAGFGYEFVERSDGLPGLEQRYGLSFRSVRSMQQALKYNAARGDDDARQIDVLDVYTTDGQLLTYDLVVLEDDRDFFPPYEAAPLVAGSALERHPEIAGVLGLLAGAFDESLLRSLNRRLQEDGESEQVVARETLITLGLIETPAIAGGTAAETSGMGERVGLLRYLWNERAAILRLTLEHLGISALALVLGILVAVPLGLALERRPRLAEPVIRIVGITQTIPSLALLAFMVPWLGIGFTPAIVALWIYSLLPILRNTYTGVAGADPSATEAATALGMTPTEVLTQIRLPLAAPVIMAGVRTAGVITIGTATLAAFIGAGGLGEPIVTGLQLADSRRILSGAIPAALLALLADTGLGWLARRLNPRGLRRQDPHRNQDRR